MGWSKTMTVNGYQFEFQNLGFDEGVTVNPKRHDLNDPDVLHALKIALEAYPIVNRVMIFMGASHYYGIQEDDRLRRQMHVFDDELIELHISEAKMVETQTYVTVPDYTIRYIEFLRAEKYRRDEKARKASKKQEKRLATGAGYVYLIQSPTGAYKIGRTKNPKDRMKTFGVQLPFEVEFVHLIETPDMYTLESDLHKRFEERRVNGEWFALEPADIEFIKGLVS